MEVKFLPNDVEFWIAARITPPRTDGVHVSTLVLAMLQQVSKHYRSWGAAGRPARSAIYEMGYVWEDALADALSRRAKFGPNQMLMPAQEIQLDDIYGNPDRLLFDHEERRFVVEETKLTWMTARGVDQNPHDICDEVKFQYWLMQKKCYAAMIHLGYGAKAGALVRRTSTEDRIWFPELPPLINLRALFVNGTYTGDLAKPIGWQFEYTHDELADFWASVVRFRDEHFPATHQEKV